MWHFITLDTGGLQHIAVEWVLLKRTITDLSMSKSDVLQIASVALFVCTALHYSFGQLMEDIQNI